MLSVVLTVSVLLYIYQPVILDYYSGSMYYKTSYQIWNSSWLRSSLNPDCVGLNSDRAFEKYSSWSASRSVSSLCMCLPLLSYLSDMGVSQWYNNIYGVIVNLGLITFLCVALIYSWVSGGLSKKCMVYKKIMCVYVLLLLLLMLCDIAVMCLSVCGQLSVEPIDSELNVGVKT